MDVPDVAGKQVRVQVLMGALMATARARIELEVTRVANGHEMDDPVAVPEGEPQTELDGTVITYALRLSALAVQDSRLAEAYPDEMQMVTAMVKRRDGEETDHA